MSLIAILILIVFIGLLAQAICETIWGICLIVHGLFWHAIAAVLTILAKIIRIARKLRNCSHLKTVC